jgi:Flp pilus assembly protein CpaB
MPTPTNVLAQQTAPTPPNGSAPPVIRPRRGLPSGRAVVGALLITAAALGTLLAYQGASTTPTTTYVVAAADLDPGERVSLDALRDEAIDLPESTRAGAFTDPSLLDGAVALAPIRAGELVQASAVVLPGAGEDAASPGAREFSFAVDRTRALNGTLNRGERVDLLATYGSGETARTHVIVRDALVVEIDNDSDDTIGAAATITMSLALPTSDDVLEAAHATQVGAITVVRTTKAADDSAGATSYATPSGETDVAPPATDP